MAAEVTSQVAYDGIPALGLSVYVLTYTKTGATDTLAVTTYTNIKTIVYAKAMVDAAGADDPLTWSSNVITLSTGTGAGRCLVVGTD